MKCVFCGNDTLILETRESGDTTRRRHECVVCHKRFTTKEVTSAEYDALMELKRQNEKNKAKFEFNPTPKLISLLEKRNIIKTLKENAQKEAVK